MKKKEIISSFTETAFNNFQQAFPFLKNKKYQ
jgi:hypothetical protein